MTKALTTEEFILRAKEVHGDKYDYSLTKYIKSTIKVKIICKQHTEFMQAPFAHLSGCGCPECKKVNIGNSHRKGKKEFIKQAIKKHNDKFNYDKVKYINSDTNIKIFCNKHKIYFEVTPYTHLKGNGSCPKCRYETTAIKNSFTKEQFIEKANKVHREEYDYSLVKYKNNATKVKIICKIHNVFEQTPGMHLAGQGCPFCYGKQAKSKEQFIIEAKGIHGDIYDYSKVKYVNANEKVTIICNKKGHGEFEQLPCNHLSKKYGCPKCGTIKCTEAITDTLEQFITKANKKHNNLYDYSNVKYIKSQEKVTIICKLHGPFDQIPSSHLFGTRCPKCFPQESRAEQEIKAWIKSNGVKAISAKKILQIPCSNSQDIDIYMPDYNLGIEHNGIYWHSEEKEKGQFYHLNKTKQALKQGIQLLHFWDFEWSNKQEIVKSIILNKLGKSENRYFARKLKLIIIKSVQARRFCEDNHIHGFRSGSQYLGLFDSEQLISLMITAKNGEMVRFVNKINCSVIGGFSKLLKYSNVKYSFVDRRMFNGQGYLKNGFILERKTKPNYFYVKNGNYAGSRQQFQKHKLKGLLNIFDENLSEVKNMTNNGFYRVFDCGNLVMRYKS